MMDNRYIDIKAEGRKAFDLAIGVAFADTHRDATAKGYRLDAERGLILYRFDVTATEKAKGAAPFPFAMNASQAADFVWAWLVQIADKDHKEWRDHDGSNGKGFRVHATCWGHVEGEANTICAVQAIWAWYGK